MLVIHSCKKSEIYPNIPEIEFESFYFVKDPSLGDTLIGVTFSYKDGDGDIGLNPKDTFPPFNSIIGPNDQELNPYHYNLHIEYLTLQEGEFRPVILPNSTDTFKVQARIKNITPEGKHKAIRGTIDWKIFPPDYPDLSRTVKLKIKIYDRALHVSNIVESPEIQLP